MKSRAKYLPHYRLLAAVCFTALGMSGCAQLQSTGSHNNWVSAGQKATDVDPELHQFLQNAAELSSAFFEQTPWGNQAEVTLQSRYFSGSGRECVRLQVVPAAVEAKPAVACQQKGQWVSVRPVTQLLNAQ